MFDIIIEISTAIISIIAFIFSLITIRNTRRKYYTEFMKDISKRKEELQNNITKIEKKDEKN